RGTAKAALGRQRMELSRYARRNVFPALADQAAASWRPATAAEPLRMTIRPSSRTSRSGSWTASVPTLLNVRFVDAASTGSLSAHPMPNTSDIDSTRPAAAFKVSLIGVFPFDCSKPFFAQSGVAQRRNPASIESETNTDEGTHFNTWSNPTISRAREPGAMGTRGKRACGRPPRRALANRRRQPRLEGIEQAHMEASPQPAGVSWAK